MSELTQSDKEWLKQHCRCNHRDTDRTGLYIMVFIILMNSCDDCGYKEHEPATPKEHIEQRVTEEKPND